MASWDVLSVCDLKVMSSEKRQLKLPRASEMSCTTQRPCQVSSLDGAETLTGCAKQCQTPLEAPA